MKVLNYCNFMEDKMKLFRFGVKKIAKVKHYSQIDIAKGIDSKQATISSYLRGRTQIPSEIIQNITTFLKTPYEEILETGRIELGLMPGEPTIPQDQIETLFKRMDKLESIIPRDQGMLSSDTPHAENYRFKPSPADPEQTIGLLYQSLATQYVDEALKETGRKISDKKREKLIKATTDDMKKNLKLTKVNLKKHLEIFEDAQ